jgi:hypothetical protein
VLYLVRARINTFSLKGVVMPSNYWPNPKQPFTYITGIVSMSASIAVLVCLALPWYEWDGTIFNFTGKALVQNTHWLTDPDPPIWEFLPILMIIDLLLNITGYWAAAKGKACTAAILLFINSFVVVLTIRYTYGYDFIQGRPEIGVVISTIANYIIIATNIVASGGWIWGAVTLIRSRANQ